ncbi:hypothetical protein DSM112329_04201 [Paraconexibacter sp. AEG42_29]|uniref:HTH tetR-type domain-containing protein n=1 Tax=Paraconexibacter sp. AEG42_29 TaxID=2997339 RepID=A0AAU7B0A3_9ACTN
MPAAARAPAGAETKATRTRRRIIAAAATEFAAGGYEGASLRNVAAAADLQLGSLYFHFASKDELIIEVLRDAIEFALERLDEALAALGDQAGPADRLSAAIDAHLGALHESRSRGTAVVRMLDPLPASIQDRNVVQTRRYARYWSRLLTEAQQAGVVASDLDIRVTRDLLLAAMNGSVLSTRSGPVYVRACAQSLKRMLLTPM